MTGMILAIELSDHSFCGAHKIVAKGGSQERQRALISLVRAWEHKSGLMGFSNYNVVSRIELPAEAGATVVAASAADYKGGNPIAVFLDILLMTYLTERSFLKNQST